MRQRTKRMLGWFLAAAIYCLCVATLPRVVTAQTNGHAVFLLEDSTEKQWCAFTNRAQLDSSVSAMKAPEVATLTYRDRHVVRIDLAETDESGDWMVYDHYLLDEAGHVTRLSRLINVLPGDRSVSRIFSLKNGKVAKIREDAKQLSTGKRLRSPKPVWLPDLPVETAMSSFPFSRLLQRDDFPGDGSACVDVSGANQRAGTVG